MAKCCWLRDSIRAAIVVAAAMATAAGERFSARHSPRVFLRQKSLEVLGNRAEEELAAISSHLALTMTTPICLATGNAYTHTHTHS